jgi:co-chaperonin GroES (HSP10)
MAPGAAEKPKRGLCIAVGPGRYDNKAGCWIYPPCKPGDVVFVRHWNGADVLVNGVKHEIFNAAEIIGVETDDAEVIKTAYKTGNKQGLQAS